MQFPRAGAESFSEDRPLGWDPAAAGSRAGDGMARFVSEEKAARRAALRYFPTQNGSNTSLIRLLVMALVRNCPPSVVKVRDR